MAKKRCAPCRKGYTRRKKAVSSRRRVKKLHCVKTRGGSRATKCFKTAGAALKAARRLSKKRGREFVVRGGSVAGL